MPTCAEFLGGLELAESLVPAAGFAAIMASALLFARQGWRWRGHWHLNLPWSATARYLKRVHREYGHLHQLGYGTKVAFYILNAHPGARQKYDAGEAHELDGLMNLAALEGRSLIVTGGPHSGKTTFLQALAIRASTPGLHRQLGFARPRLPLYLPLRELDLSLPFAQALELALRRAGMPLKPRTLQRALRRGRALCLLDGLEQIPPGHRRQEMLQWLEQAHDASGPAPTFVIAGQPEVLLAEARFPFPCFTVALRNYAVQRFRALRAVSETRMPLVFKNPLESDSEYSLVAPPHLPTVLAGARTPAPHYHYYLARHLVTNRLYRAFVEANRHREPLFWREPAFAGEELPVVGIDWEDAESYCRWLNRLSEEAAHRHSLPHGFVFRLPTEEEWEWAAGGNSRRFPWGDTPPDARHALFGAALPAPAPVDAHPAGATPAGLMDMAGNVWEWTGSAAGAHPEKRVVRGGAAYNVMEALECRARDVRAKSRARFIGFRVARVAENAATSGNSCLDT